MSRAEMRTTPPLRVRQKQQRLSGGTTIFTDRTAAGKTDLITVAMDHVTVATDPLNVMC